MKLSMYTGLWGLIRRQGFEAAAIIAKDYGFSNIEIFDEPDTKVYTHIFEDVASAENAKKILDNLGLSVSCYSIGVNLVNVNGEIKKNDWAIEALKRHADVAAAVGSPFIHHTLIYNYSLKPDSPTLDDVIHLVVEAASEVANYCEPLGITCIYEPQGAYLNGVENFGRFYREMKARCKNVGVCGDMGNTLFADVMPIDFFTHFADDIVHVHLKDYRYWQTLEEGETFHNRSRNGSYLKRMILGSGDVNAATCLDILKAKGYNGVFSLEDDYDELYPERVGAACNLLKNYFYTKKD